MVWEKVSKWHSKFHVKGWRPSNQSYTLEDRGTRSLLVTAGSKREELEECEQLGNQETSGPQVPSEKGWGMEYSPVPVEN